MLAVTSCKPDAAPYCRAQCCSQLAIHAVCLQVEIAGKSVRVFVFPEAPAGGSQPAASEQSVARYTFQVGSVDTFERQLESAQARTISRSAVQSVHL